MRCAAVGVAVDDDDDGDDVVVVVDVAAVVAPLSNPNASAARALVLSAADFA